MPQYVISYIGGRQPDTPEEGQAHFAKWKQWLEDLGTAVVNPGTPMKGSKTLSGTTVKDTPHLKAPTGFSIVEAADMDAAIKIAQACPFLEMGDLEVGEVQQMNM